jgi:hypothetical protein
LTADQRTVVAGIAAACVFSAAFVLVALRLPLFEAPAAATEAERVAYALRCDFWAALALLAGIGRIANQRFVADEIDGSVPPRARSLEVHRAYLQNTTEQLLLLVFAHVGLALAADAASLRLVPILVALFLVGRAAFWIGYLRSPPARAFGFATTFYPTVAVYVYAALRLAAGG